MNISYLFIVLFFVYITALAIYFLFSKGFSKTINYKRIKISEKQEEYFTHFEKNRPRQTDLLSSLFFLIYSLHEDGKKNCNYVIFDYSMNYPRIFNIDSSNIIKLTDAMAQIMLLNTSESTIIIKFLLSSYHKEHVKFTISIWSDNNFAKDYRTANMIHVKMNKESRKFLKLARKLAVQNRSDIKFDFDTANSIKISTNITMQLSDTKSNTLDNVKINKNNNIKALIAENNSHAFKILKKDLELIGVEVKPSGDWRIIKRHIEDVIFNPDIVFIQSAIINTAAFKEIESFFVDKNIAMVIIKNNKYQYKLDSKIYIQYLPQPYTPDVLINILNNIQNYRLSGKRNTLITL